MVVREGGIKRGKRLLLCFCATVYVKQDFLGSHLNNGKKKLLVIFRLCLVASSKRFTRLKGWEKSWDKKAEGDGNRRCVRKGNSYG